MCSTIAEAKLIERGPLTDRLPIFSMADLFAAEPDNDGLPPWTGGVVA